MAMRFTVVLEGVEYNVEVTEDLQVVVDDRSYQAKVKTSGSKLQVRIGRRSYEFQLSGRRLSWRGSPLEAHFEGYVHRAARWGQNAAPIGDGLVRAPMPGRVVAVVAEEGSKVTLGTPLVILEAMKMQNEIPSPVEGVVREIRVAVGAAVSREQVLMVIQ